MPKKIDPSKISKNFEKRVGRLAATDIVLELIRDGIITTKGKSQGEIAGEVATLLRSALQKGLKLILHVDHSGELLAQARQFFRDGELELSALFYSTYFEHRLNWLIAQFCYQKKIADSEFKQLIRDANIKAKCTWVMTVLGKRPLKVSFVKSILEISEIRNAFVHYKWPEQKLDEGRERSDLKKLEKAEAVVKYLRRFGDQRLYQNQRTRVQKAVKASVFRED